MKCFEQRESGYSKEHDKLLEDHQNWERKIGSKRVEVIHPIEKRETHKQRFVREAIDYPTKASKVGLKRILKEAGLLA